MLELTEITRLEELTNTEDANAYLALGWKVLNTYTTAYATEGPGCNHLTAHYVMAWYGADPRYPPPKYSSIGITL